MTDMGDDIHRVLKSVAALDVLRPRLEIYSRRGMSLWGSIPWSRLVLHPSGRISLRVTISPQPRKCRCLYLWVISSMMASKSISVASDGKTGLPPHPGV